MLFQVYQIESWKRKCLGSKIYRKLQSEINIYFKRKVYESL